MALGGESEVGKVSTQRELRMTFAGALMLRGRHAKRLRHRVTSQSVTLPAEALRSLWGQEAVRADHDTRRPQ